MRIECEKLFKEVEVHDGNVSIRYSNVIDKDKKKKIIKNGTPLYYFNPWEEEEENGNE